jgi:hypothetical protein
MLSYTTIADVGLTLIRLLRENMGDLLADVNTGIVLLSPADVKTEGSQDIRLTLFLYHVVESASLRNQPYAVETSTESRVPPLSLDLYYMLTSYPSQAELDLSDRILGSQRILGRAMRIFYDNGILSGPALQGRLASTDEELRITLNPITLEDLTRVWSVFPDTAYITSVSYLVTPARIRSERTERGQRVVSKEMNHGVIVPNRGQR